MKSVATIRRPSASRGPFAKASEAVLRATRAAADALSKLGIPYAVFGGVGVNLWRRVRVTKDGDILVASGADATAIREALRAAGFAHHEGADRVRLAQAGVYRFWYPLVEQSVSIKVDIVVGRADYHRKVLERSVKTDLQGTRCSLASIEDCILLKCVANRAIDRADAVELVRIHGPALDRGYLAEWAARLKVENILEEVVAESEQPENPY